MADHALPARAIPVSFDWHRGSVDLIEVPDSETVGRTGAVWVDTTPVPEGSGRWTGTVDALELLVACERPPLPAGLIFHTGRCGSTLLANILATHPGLRVLSEPNVLSQLLIHRGFADRAEPGLEARLLFSAFSRGTHEGRGAVVKLSTWHVLAARHLLASLPGVPAVFLWRPAAEVVASCLHQPPPWAGFQDLRALLARQVPLLRGTDDPCTARAELFARMWNATVRAGLDLVYDLHDRVSVLAYDDVRAHPAAMGGHVAGRFGLSGTNALAAAMAGAAGRYSKDLSGRTVFDPRGAHARPPLNSAERSLVARVTAPFEDEIRSLIPRPRPAGSNFAVSTYR